MSVIEEEPVWLADEEERLLEAAEYAWLQDEGRVWWLEQMHAEDDGVTGAAAAALAGAAAGVVIRAGKADGVAVDGGDGVPVAAAVPATGAEAVARLARDLGGWRQVLGQAVQVGADGTVVGLDEAGHLDLLRGLEDLKSAAGAAQAVLTASFDQARRDREATEGMAASRRGRGVGAEVALARRLSPHQGSRQLGLARRLVAGMPHTLAAMRAGTLSESRAALVAGEAICLDQEEQTRFDEALCADPEQIATWGDRRVVAEARRCAYELSPRARAERCRRAANDRRVTLRPAAEAMAHLSALLPASQALAVYGSLLSAADSGRAAGDPRGKGQLMADTLVERTTGQQAADVVPMSVQLVMSDRALFTTDNDQPAVLPGYGLVAADWARELVRTAMAHTDQYPGTGVWLRRLYTHPDSGQLMAMDSRARIAPRGLRDFIGLRDEAICRSPWCDAPVRHTDHITPHSRGGPTSAENLQGACERCNYIKELPGWEARLVELLDGPCNHPGSNPPEQDPPSSTDPPDTASRAGRRPRRVISRASPPVRTTTPTGHSYLSRPPRRMRQ